MSGRPDVEYRLGTKGPLSTTLCAVVGDAIASNCALMVPIETLRDQDLETYRVACLQAAIHFNGQAAVADREQNRREPATAPRASRA